MPRPLARALCSVLRSSARNIQTESRFVLGENGRVQCSDLHSDWVGRHAGKHVWSMVLRIQLCKLCMALSCKYIDPFAVTRSEPGSASTLQQLFSRRFAESGKGGGQVS